MPSDGDHLWLRRAAIISRSTGEQHGAVGSLQDTLDLLTTVSNVHIWTRILSSHHWNALSLSPAEGYLIGEAGYTTKESNLVRVPGAASTSLRW